MGPITLEQGANAWVGISGWRYPPWRGVFYPPGLRQADELQFASRALSSIEINGSFYSLQTPASYARWRDATPADFAFALKGGRYITHMKRLQNVEQGLRNFFASGVLELGPKLGPLLWQLPPSLRFDAAVVDRFLSQLPKSQDDILRSLGLDSRHAASAPTLRHSIEVRHESFRTPAFVDLLRRHSVSCCVADSAGKYPMLEAVTAGFVYLRLHGSKELYASGYSSRELRRWAEKVRLWGAQGLDVYVYFDNDVKVHAPFDAINLARLLGGQRLLPRRRDPRATVTLARGLEVRRGMPAMHSTARRQQPVKTDIVRQK
jgi:uncharacterized protein YecE (DUF72 family)